MQTKRPNRNLFYQDETYFDMKTKEKLLIGAAAGVGAAALVYTLWPKRSVPEGATVVQPFDRNRYLGKWHEIARLPNKIEQNIKHLTEEYSLQDDGMIEVITKGYDTKDNEWTAMIGKAKSAGPEDVGKLKVSYFGPFYAAYNVLDVDADYRYALVSGSGLDYLWILSREPSIPEDIKNRFLKKAAEIGFDTGKLEWEAA